MASPSSTFLEAFGFKLTKSCQCGGAFTETWQKGAPLTIVEVKPTKDWFRIRTSRPRITGPLSALEAQVRAHVASTPAVATSGPYAVGVPVRSPLALSAPCKNC